MFIIEIAEMLGMALPHTRNYIWRKEHLLSSEIETIWYNQRFNIEKSIRTLITDKVAMRLNESGVAGLARVLNGVIDLDLNEGIYRG